MTDRSTDAPLYERIKALVLQQIASGAWAVAQRIPSEHELVRLVGASRMTVNRALRELTAAGYLVRAQGVGTFVADRPAAGHALAIRDIVAEIVGRGQRHSARVLLLERCVAAAALAAHFNLRRGDALFHSRLVHLQDAVPIQLEDRYVNPAVAPGYLEQDFSATTPEAYLSKLAPLQSVQHRVLASRADHATARVLQMEAAQPCLVVQRRTWTRSVVATAVTLSHPASRFQLTSHPTGRSSVVARSSWSA